ncbi:unnamed protein product [Strongylus vulgaris]|uniref:Uncharacterized protein n=1 Tax=Strongylus vulgaris TaxID=40348 RepID=A0A3P7IDG6_STRVU|nr:unnamed protein product [Strongylus vulgaris]
MRETTAITLMITEIYISNACVRVVPTPPPTTTPVVPTCRCPTNLYNTGICPQVGTCYEAPDAVTYGPPPLCPPTINCPNDYYIRIQFTDGRFLNNSESVALV